MNRLLVLGALLLGSCQRSGAASASEPGPRPSTAEGVNGTIERPDRPTARTGRGLVGIRPRSTAREGAQARASSAQLVPLLNATACAGGRRCSLTAHLADVDPVDTQTSEVGP